MTGSQREASSDGQTMNRKSDAESSPSSDPVDTQLLHNGVFIRLENRSRTWLLVQQVVILRSERGTIK